jgi:putative hydrolase of the HAD superfamily
MKTALFAGDERSLKWRRDDKRCKNLSPDLVITELQQLTACVELPN